MFAVTTLKLKIRYLFEMKFVEKVHSVDPDQTQSDLGLHCLPMPVCPKT